MRVGLLTNIPSPYRVPLFRHLADDPSITFHVAFNATSESNRQWGFSSPDFGFDHTFLRSRSISIGKDDKWIIHFNTGVRRWILSNHLDVVILGGWSGPTQILALLLCKMMNIPVVLWSGSIEGNNSRMRTFTRPMVRMIVRSCRSYIAYGTAARKYLIRLGANPDNIHIAYNAVNNALWRSESQRINPKEVRSELRIGSDVLFAFSGQLIERKGVMDLLESFARVRARLPGCRLILAGSGPQEAAISQRIDALRIGDSVTMMGETGPKDLARIYSAADVTILPSKYEVWGLVVNESMNCATPVIVSSEVGARHDLIIEGETGWVFDTSDVSSLVRIMSSCIAEGRDALRMHGIEAANHVENMATIEQAAAAIVKAVRQAAQ